MKTIFNEERFSALQTPFYYYDIELLRRTLSVIAQESSKYNFHVHYAVKANANDRILEEICSAGFGADCVSGYEVQKALF